MTPNHHSLDIPRSTRTLARRDPRMAKLIKLAGPIPFSLPLWNSIDETIATVVIGQMLSSAAADTIYRKLLKRLHTPTAILDWAERSSGKKGAVLGVSQRKRKAMAGWRRYHRNQPNSWKRWPTLPLEEFQKEVSRLWGFGNWSADMIGIFFLCRPDIWATGDLGLKKAASMIFQTDDLESLRPIVRGHETVAALYFWEILNKKIQLPS